MNRAHGSLEQMIAAFESRIEELGGSAIESSRKIRAARKKEVKATQVFHPKNKVTASTNSQKVPERFISRLRDELDNLSLYHDDLRPVDDDTVDNLVDKYIYWVDEYNDGYMPEDESEYGDWMRERYAQEHPSDDLFAAMKPSKKNDRTWTKRSMHFDDEEEVESAKAVKASRNISSDPRYFTHKLCSIIAELGYDEHDVLMDLLTYLSDDEVGDFALSEGYLEEDEDGDVEASCATDVEACGDANRPFDQSDIEGATNTCNVAAVPEELDEVNAASDVNFDDPEELERYIDAIAEGVTEERGEECVGAVQEGVATFESGDKQAQILVGDLSLQWKYMPFDIDYVNDALDRSALNEG